MKSISLQMLIVLSVMACMAAGTLSSHSASTRTHIALMAGR
ncbi:MAG: hypothetical protein WCJ15_11720 [Alphaproteobacteria bacterium]|jgi:hypothetical protein